MMTKPCAASVSSFARWECPKDTGSHLERSTLELRSASISQRVCDITLTVSVAELGRRHVAS